VSSITEILARTDADPLVIDNSGTLVVWPLPAELGRATLLVGEVVDAVKVVEGDRVVGSRDRDGLFRLEGVVVARELLEAIGDVDARLPVIIDAVTDLGETWKPHLWDGSAGA
jgi:hypothetical protein